MSRVLVIVGAGMAMLIAGAAAYWMSRPEPAPSSPEPAPLAVPGRIPEPIKPRSATRRSEPPAPKTTPDLAPDARPATGTLIIESDVPGTSVFVDRVYLGNAPVTVPDLTPGPHRLNMSAAGYEGISETIEVAAGTHTLSIKFKEIRLDESTPVIHKHGMGSCTGMLRATPQGLRYQTTNEGDAFTAPLTSLETFELDYLEENLRVKVRGGKTYNFTHRDGDVDRLYRFHEAAEKVRLRLLSGKRP